MSTEEGLPGALFPLADASLLIKGTTIPASRS
jgi:hypothetical protein